MPKRAPAKKDGGPDWKDTATAAWPDQDCRQNPLAHPAKGYGKQAAMDCQTTSLQPTPLQNRPDVPESRRRSDSTTVPSTRAVIRVALRCRTNELTGKRHHDKFEELLEVRCGYARDRPPTIWSIVHPTRKKPVSSVQHFHNFPGVDPPESLVDSHSPDSGRVCDLPSMSEARHADRRDHR